jgi:hypothetical protein
MTMVASGAQWLALAKLFKEDQWRRPQTCHVVAFGRRIVVVKLDLLLGPAVTARLAEQEPRARHATAVSRLLARASGHAGFLANPGHATRVFAGSHGITNLYARRQ